MEIHSDGEVLMRGGTRNDADIYRSADALRSSPSFASLTLKSTSPTDSLGFVDFELRGSRIMAAEGDHESE